MLESKNTTEPDEELLDQVDEPLLGEDVSPHRSEIRWPLYLHGGLIILYTSIFIFLLVVGLPGLASSCLDPTQEVPCHAHKPLPDRNGLVWEQRLFPTNIEDNPFAGVPRPELDTAWHDLLHNDNIKVPKAYLEEKGLTSVYTKDGSEGIASLSVYHSLHCLKKIKRMLFKEVYHQDKSDLAMQREAKHVDHCVEYIRESLMCQPDLSMVTFRWINDTAQHPDDNSGYYPTNFDVDMHTCAEWGALDSWAAERSFNLFDVDLLLRPDPMGTLAL